jgi:hypothetical protein
LTNFNTDREGLARRAPLREDMPLREVRIATTLIYDIGANNGDDIV